MYIIPKLNTDASRRLADRVMMLIDVSRECISRTSDQVEALYRLPDARRQTSVAKHVDITRARQWWARRDAYQACKAAPVDDEGAAEASAFQAMVATRVPDLRALHEKLTLIDQHDGWSVDGAVRGIFDDVEALVRADAAFAKTEA